MLFRRKSLFSEPTPRAFERLESRCFLSAGAVELGPQTGFHDQPYVDIELFDGTTGLGPYDSGFGIFPYNHMLLDTGANSVLIVSEAAAELESAGYQTEGLFWEQGVAGYTEFDVSAPYGLRFQGTNDVVQTIPQSDDAVRFLSNPDIHLAGSHASEGGIPGVFGMPLMVDRITQLDMSMWLDIDDIFSIDPVGVTFPTDLPDGEHRFSILVDDRVSFLPEEGIPTGAPSDTPLPVWADIPFFTGIASHHDRAKAANFLLDTGAQMSLISSTLAFDIGLDTDGDGNFDNEAVEWIPIGGVGGTTNAPVLWMERFDVPTEEGVELSWKSPSNYDLGVMVNPSNGATTVSESGDIDTFDIVLTAEPTSEVTVQWIGLDGQLNIVDDSSGLDQPLRFNTSNWDIPQTVRVLAVNDTAFEGTHSGVIQLVVSSSDVNFDDTLVPNINVSIVDDEISGPGVQVLGVDVLPELGESGGSAACQFILSSPPSASVTISLSSPDGQLEILEPGTLDNDSLVFDPTNWDIPQRVVFSATDDDLIEGSHRGSLVYTIGSTDPAYDVLADGSVSIEIRDNDGGLQMLVLDIAEGIDGVFGVDLLTSGLDFQIDSFLNVTLAGDPFFHDVYFDFRDFGQGSGTLYFDLNAEYDQTSAIDPGVLIRSMGISTSVVEGGQADTYEVVLRTQPNAEVTVTPSNADGQLIVSDDIEGDADLTFTPANWDIPQRIRVLAFNDGSGELDHTAPIRHTTTSDDLLYNTLQVADMTVLIAEGDLSPAVLISQTEGSTEVVEGGSSDSYQVVLTTEPTEPVTISIGSNSQLTATDSQNPSHDYLQFDSENWNITQTVTVTAVDDLEVEGVHGATITHSSTSSDTDYDGITIPSLDVSISDNDPILVATYDIDGNGVADALSDGLLILRYLFDFSGDSLVKNALATDATRVLPEEVVDYLSRVESIILDVDDNGSADALTDGLLIFRYLFDFRGDALLKNAVSNDGQRTEASEIESFLAQNMPGESALEDVALLTNERDQAMDVLAYHQTRPDWGGKGEADKTLSVDYLLRTGRFDPHPRAL